jgi:hypothetical protein
MASWLFNLKLLAAVCLLSAIFLPGCGDITSIGSIIVTPARITIGINQSKFFTALGRNGGGFLVATTPTWSVQGSIGTINSLSGLFLAGTVEGTGTVIATDAESALSGSAEVTITKKGWLQGNVTDSNGNIVNGIRVYLAEAPALGDETDSGGNYSIADIPAGTYEAVINPTVTYTDGATTEVTIGEGKTVAWSPVLSTPSTTSTTTVPLF